MDFDLQNHPLKIVANGYWENFSENYDLKDLSKNPSVVPKPAPEDSLAYPALGITQKELETLDKYDLDEVTYLKKEKEIPETVKIHDDIEETKDLGIDFVEEGDEEDCEDHANADAHVLAS